MMRRSLVALFSAGLALALAGCGSGGGLTLPPAEPAAPEVAQLDWVETYGPRGSRLVFRVERLEVRNEGWTAAVSVTNRTGTAFVLGGIEHPLDRAFGVMVFSTGDLRELEQRNRAGELPPVREASSFSPPLPGALAPGATWRSEISAGGSLPARAWVRVSFGPLVAVGAPPKGVEPRIVWITDHAYPL